MTPCQAFFNKKLFIIRPLAFAGEDIIIRYSRDNRFPDFVNSCPSAKTSKRREIKDMLNRLYAGNKKIRGNIFKSLSHVKSEYLLK
jgi:tRNA 2-thiocytidine biosynthesis protein TtcA